MACQICHNIRMSNIDRLKGGHPHSPPPPNEGNIKQLLLERHIFMYYLFMLFIYNLFVLCAIDTTATVITIKNIMLTHHSILYTNLYSLYGTVLAAHKYFYPVCARMCRTRIITSASLYLLYS